MNDEELRAAYQKALDEAHSAPKAGAEFGGYSSNAVFAPANKAIELREEMKRRGLLRRPS